MTQPAPTITSLTLSPTSGPVGSLLTATVVYGDTATSPEDITVTAKVTDPTTGLSTSAPVTFVAGVIDAATCSISDSGNHVWTKASDNGSTAVFTTTV